MPEKEREYILYFYDGKVRRVTGKLSELQKLPVSRIEEAPNHEGSRNMTEQKISPALVIVGGLGLGLVATVGLFALTRAAAPVAKYRFSYIGNEPLGTGGIRFIEPPESQLTFNEGDTLIIEAVPRDGYQFAGWWLDGVLWSIDNPLTLTMNPATMAPDVSHELIATYVPV